MTESCPDDILSYQTTTLPFQTSLIDLFIPDRSVVAPCHSIQGSDSIADTPPIYPFFFHFNWFQKRHEVLNEDGLPLGELPLRAFLERKVAKGAGAHSHTCMNLQ